MQMANMKKLLGHYNKHSQMRFRNTEHCGQSPGDIADTHVSRQIHLEEANNKKILHNISNRFLAAVVPPLLLSRSWWHDRIFVQAA
jgi:hypothetical protein